MGPEENEAMRKLRDRFPEMEPIAKAPALFTINGCGLMMYGKRDEDAETGTYVKTRFLTFLFIPILALRSFRVADAPSGGWVFLGRVPLSGAAQAWNFLVLAVALVCGGAVAWVGYTNSPEYKASAKMAEARDLEASGEHRKAMEAYVEVHRGGTSHAPQARDAIRAILAEKLAAVPAADAQAMLSSAAECEDAGAPVDDKAKVYGCGAAAADARAKDDPRGALAALAAVAPLAGDAKAHAAKREGFLEQALRKHPDDPDLAGELAAAFEERGEIGKCEALLEPLAAKLGSGEGARILGRIYMQKGRQDAAFDLLSAYADRHMKDLHAASKAFEDACQRQSDACMTDLRKGAAGKSWYDKYGKEDDAGKQAMVDEYVSKRMKGNRALAVLRDNLRAAAKAVPVTLDLGQIRLDRAQSLADPEARRKELEAAEKVFLSIQGVAGDSPKYKLIYGQVLYWMGKHKEGRALFDEMMKADGRSSESLMEVASVMRQLGAHSETRSLCEEVYEREKDPAKKAAVAHLRAVTSENLDEKILWLQRCQSENPIIKSALESALGSKALAEADKERAAGHLRASIGIQEKFTSNETVLNNIALDYLTLFHASGDRAAYRKAAECMAEAVRLRPQGAILLSNAAHMLVGSALLDVIGDRVDYKRLETSPSFELLRHLYRDEAGRKELADRLLAHKDMVQAIAFERKVLTLSPKSAGAYRSLAEIYRFAHDTAGLRELRDRLARADLDLNAHASAARSQIAGEKIGEHRAAAAKVMEQRRKILASLPDDAAGFERSIAAAEAAEACMAIGVLDAETDSDKAVELAEEAYARNDSSASRWMAVTARLDRAVGALARKEPAVQAMSARMRRVLARGWLLPIAVERNPGLRETASADPDVRRALELMREDMAAFPQHGSLFSCAVFRSLGAEEASKAEETWRRAEATRLGGEIESALQTMSAGVLLNGYWSERIAGNEAKGLDILRAGVKRGVPMPFDP